MKVLFVENNDMTFFSFRRELYQTLLAEGHNVLLVGNFTEKVINYVLDKSKVVLLKSDLKSKNIFNNLHYKNKLQRVIRNFEPDIVLSFTIKPNLYCNWKKNKCPSIANITGLGKAFQKKGLLKFFVVRLYKKCFKNVDIVFFQNSNCLQEFKDHKIPINSYRIIPGSGVNTSKFMFQTQKAHSNTTFLYASRFIKEKGFDLMMKSVPIIVSEFPDTRFSFAGKHNKHSLKAYNLLIKKGLSKNIEFLPFSDNVQDMYAKCDFLVSPSYYREGISNVLLESLAVGRPIITTNDNPGCADVLDEGKNGFGVKSNDLNSLVEALKKAINISQTQKYEMGKFGRKFVETNFNRNTTNQIYLECINDLCQKR